MNLLEKTITLNSFRSRQEIINNLKNNIEPWHKDSSKLRYEGYVNDDGTFKAKPCPDSPYNTRNEKPEFYGVIETTPTGCLVHLTFYTSQAVILLLIIQILLFIIGILVWFKIISIGFPWYGPIIFSVLSMFFTYFSIDGERNQVVENLKWLIR